MPVRTADSTPLENENAPTGNTVDLNTRGFQFYEGLEKGVPVRERLRISPSCPLILSFHVALDQAREKARGELKIGTTGRGIGPA